MGTILIEKTKLHVEEYMSKYDASHDWSHILRVLTLAQKIEASERILHPERVYDSKLVTLSALLHDIGDRKYLKAGEDGNTMVSSWLQSQGVDPSYADKVQLICTNVSYTNETKNKAAVEKLAREVPELGIVQDADRLDAIGAVGVARLFAFTGAKCNGRSLSVDHFYEKLLSIKDRIKTETGRQLAEERTNRLRLFLRWWDEETAGVGGVHKADRDIAVAFNQSEHES